MSTSSRIRLIMLLALGLIGAAVAISAGTQRSVAHRAFERADSAQSRLIGILDQEDGTQDVIAGHVDGGRATVQQGRAVVTRELARAELALAPSHREDRELLERESATALRWQRAIDIALADPEGAGLAGSRARDELLDDFRDASDATRAHLRQDREADQRHATFVAAGSLLALVALLGLPAYVLFERATRRAGRMGADHARFADALQFARTPDDAYEVLRRHLDTTLPGATAVVLNRNNSADRLEPRTPVAPGSPLAAGLDGAAPDSCLAIRRGRAYARRAGEPELMSCDICGKVDGEVTCEPSLVGGEVMGSVLVEHHGTPSDEVGARLRVAVAEAAPIVANLRNLELAERRAMTDTLTGLPNKRALDETLKRMAAQADRSGEPLAAILFDLDHFKLVNDRLGHEAGDEVLAAVGVAVPLVLRTSDFVGRFGGEEFLVLLPGTSRKGAVEVAEKLRISIAAANPAHPERQVTASFGVAVLPGEARDGAELLRIADRALYTAKANGRDRVEVAATA